MFGYTLYRMVEDIFGAKLPEIRLSLRFAVLPQEVKTQENKLKLYAYSVGVETNRFENDYRVFEKVCLQLNDRIVDPEEFSPPAVHEICWAIRELGYRKPVFAFSDEVKTYIVEILLENGYFYVPRELDDLSGLLRETILERKLMSDEELSALEGEVKKNLPAVLRQDDPELDETPVGVQLAKLWFVRRYVDERTRELEQEIRETENLV